jgi:ribose-phosphate pyrophosphokinase
VQQEQFKVNQPGGFHVNNNDTTAVLSPISEQADETETNSQPAFALSPQDGRQKAVAVTDKTASGADKTAPEKKRSGRLTENKRIKIFCGSSNKALCEEICKFTGVPLGETRLQRFSDGEVHFQLLENVRGADVFLVQPTCYPVDQHLVELLIMMDALKRASAGRITVVIPYYGYARQDRKDRPRVAITSKLVADLLTTAGANRALLVDLHAAQIQGFFNIPVDHLFASPVLVSYFRELNLPNLTVVSPDAGGVERARFFAKKLEVPLAIVDKRRTDVNVTEVMNVIGDVKGRTCLILDDIIDTAGTLVKTADALLAEGAEKVYACATHPVLSGPAVERIEESRLEQVVVTNTIPLQEDAARLAKTGKIKVLSIAGLLGRAIESIHMETSVSTLFN